MNIVTVEANENIPTYKIIANSYHEEDIKEMYATKEQLIKDYANWVKGVDDTYLVLADHTYVYNATFYNGEYVITLGKGEGKALTGKLQVSYCTSTKEIKKKSFFEELFN